MKNRSKTFCLLQLSGKIPSTLSEEAVRDIIGTDIKSGNVDLYLGEIKVETDIHEVSDSENSEREMFNMENSEIQKKV